MNLDFYYEKQKALLDIYREWLCELGNKQPGLLEDKYSNPYYIAIPKGWYESKIRILIVGEEGYGESGCLKGDGIGLDEIEKIQTFNWSYLASNLLDGDVDFALYPDSYQCEVNKSPFWRRARELYKCGCCAWSNFDKIHIRREKRCALSVRERSRLHSLNKRVLQDEINILDPTHIITFGWYGISVEHELPEVFKELYPGGIKDKSRWFKSVVTISHGNRFYIFSYHPGWRNTPKGYEEWVISEFEKTMKLK